MTAPTLTLPELIALNDQLRAKLKATRLAHAAAYEPSGGIVLATDASMQLNEVYGIEDRVQRMTIQQLVAMASPTPTNSFHHRVYFGKMLEPNRYIYVATDKEARGITKRIKSYGWRAGCEYKRIDQNW